MARLTISIVGPCLLVFSSVFAQSPAGSGADAALRFGYPVTPTTFAGHGSDKDDEPSQLSMGGTSSTLADTMSARWTSVYASEVLPASAEARAVAVDKWGNAYVTGSVFSTLGFWDYLTVKYNASGIEQWSARFEGPGGNADDKPTAIAVDSAGNVYVTGRSMSYEGYDGGNYATVKYGPSGVQMWVAYYNGPEQNSGDVATAIAVDPSGNVYVTGASGVTISSVDYATIKYDSSGAVQWVARYAGTGNSLDLANAIVVDTSGNVYVTGTSGTYPVYDYATVKYDPSGVQQWDARYAGPGNASDEALALAVDGSGNVYVTGESAADYATVKYDSSGLQQWAALYNGPGNGRDRATSIAVDSGGNVHVTGQSAGSGTDFDYATVKYNPSGEQQWAARYDGPGSAADEARALVMDGAGNVAVTGRSKGPAGAEYDYATVMYDSSGTQQWVGRYDGPGSSADASLAIALDIQGNITVTGTSPGSTIYDDYVTIRYNPSGFQLWLARKEGPGMSNDVGSALTTDALGNIYVAGWSEGPGAGRGLAIDYLAIKYNSSGVQQWAARYDGPGNSWDYATAIAVDAVGSVYVTGRSYGDSTTGNGFDYATVKYSMDGEQQWVARYNGSVSLQDRAVGIVIDQSGNVYVAGSSETPTGSDYVTIKYDPSGIQQWIATYDGPASSFDAANAIAIDASNNLYVTGQSLGSETGSDCATIKYSPGGAEQWVARYNGPGNSSEGAIGIALDSSGNVYAAGGVWGSFSDYLVLKYDSSGVQQWAATYDGPANTSDDIVAIAVDKSGNAYVTGRSEGVGTSTDYATVKFNADGVLQWDVRYNGPRNDRDGATAIAVDREGSAYVTGGSYGLRSYDYATIKYDSSGAEKWIARYDRPNACDDNAAAIGLDPAGNVYVTGGSNFGGAVVCVTISYIQSVTAIGPQSVFRPESYVLFQNYPNPFNPLTVVSFQLSATRDVRLSVYDIIGREVAVLIDEKKGPGTYEVPFDASMLATGVYIYRLQAGDFIQTRKMMLLK